MYYMGDEADDILSSIQLSSEDKAKYNVVKEPSNVIFERAKFNQRRQELGKPRHYTVFQNTVAMMNYVKK